ncbi:NUDIX domain-containing protein [candidate division TA06 bacterium]|nr:NUDIX domain-containing protein [candidate division TA06 bacterium]
MEKSFNDSYIGQLRKLVGSKKLIVAGVRAVVRNKEGKILLIHRKDTNRWGMPAGSVELGESVTEALKREVKEETGLNVESAEPFAVYSEPKYSVTYPNGDQTQIFVIVFRVDEWSGELIGENDESLSCDFFGLDDLPDTHEAYIETLNDLKNYNGRFIVK